MDEKHRHHHDDDECEYHCCRHWRRCMYRRRRFPLFSIVFGATLVLFGIGSLTSNIFGVQMPDFFPFLIGLFLFLLGLRMIIGSDRYCRWYYKDQDHHD